MKRNEESFSMNLVQKVLEQTLRLVEISFHDAINSEQRLVMKEANPLQESFRKLPNTHDKFQQSPERL